MEEGEGEWRVRESGRVREREWRKVSESGG